MWKSLGRCALIALMLAACQSGSVEAPSQAQLAAELVRLKGDGPPKAREGECWESATTPAVIETITEQVRVTDEVLDASGKVITPASFQSKTHQRIVQEREVVWFRAPCTADLTVQFVASLQRALKARGLYLLPVTGALDAATAEAVRRFQEPRGLDSATLSLAAARELGLISTDPDDL